MIPFSDPDTQFRLVRDHLDARIRDAEDHRLVREAATVRVRRTGRWPRWRRDDRRPLAS